MKNKNRHLLNLLVVPLLLGVLGTGSSAHATKHKLDDVSNVIDNVTRIEENLKNWFYSQDALTKHNSAMVGYKAKATDCVTRAQEVLSQAEAELEKLEAGGEKQSAEVAQQLQAQKEERAAAQAKVAECTALGLHVDAVQAALEKKLQRQLEQTMLTRDRNIFSLLALNLKHPVAWFPHALHYISDKAWLFNQAGVSEVLGLIAWVLLALLVGVLLRQRARPWAASCPWSDSQSGRFACSFLVTTFTYAPQILASLALSSYMWVATHGSDPTDVLAAFAYGLTFLVLTNLVIRVFLHPVAPAQPLVDFAPTFAAKLATRLHVLVLLVFLGYLLVGTLVGASLPEYVYSLVRRVLRFLLAVNVIWVLWLFRHLSGLLRQGWFRHSLTTVVIAAALADLSGYYNLAGWLFRSVFGTLIVFWSITTLVRLIREFFSGLEHAQRPWQQRVRGYLGLPLSERLAGFFWLRVLVNGILWIVLLWLLVLIWDVSSSALQEARALLQEGFNIGFLHIVPTRVIFAVLALAALIALTSWVKGMMTTRLESSPMERGTREALITMTGYIGVVIAILVALGVAGIEFSNIALVAGALSVGIGFGLQNIVNNFVSGLILLFERPVKTGDWIVVGNTEGYVKRIRIRSTQLKTFDRADVIIPNSELISSQVTNWMLSDTTGRIRVPVGVAYGTDTEKVKEILLQIATDHQEVLTQSKATKPFVLFLKFGDSSLDFELRCFVRNIDKRLSVISDINFAIDKAFREAGIVIPFPQRDIHMYDHKPNDR